MNETEEPAFLWSEKQQSTLLVSFFYGYLLTNFLGGYLSYQIGGKKMFLGSLLLGSILTLITPVCAQWDFYALLTTRILLGVVQVCIFLATLFNT